MGALKLAIGALLAITLGACDDDTVQQIDGSRFCVPRANLVVHDILWIPASMPDEGFNFRLNVTSEARQVWSLRGFVTPRKTYETWQKPTTTSFYGSLLQEESPESITIGDHPFLVLEEPRIGDQSFILSAGTKGDEVPSLLSICTPALSKNGPHKALCSRVLLADDVAVNYSVPAEMLPKMYALDQAVLSRINQWRCQAR